MPRRNCGACQNRGLQQLLPRDDPGEPRHALFATARERDIASGRRPGGGLVPVLWFVFLRVITVWQVRELRRYQQEGIAPAMSSNTDYTPPKVWKWEEPSAEWRYSRINRPIAGPTHEAALPIGKHPLQLYSRATPNGVKVTVMLEELLALGHSGAEYDAWLIDIGKGEQFGSGYVEMNPNSKIPALMDRSGAKPRRVFESGSILLYLAEKFGAFLPPIWTSAPRRSIGCSGRWVVRPTLAAGSVISIITRQLRLSMRSTDMRWRRSVSWMC